MSAVQRVLLAFLVLVSGALAIHLLGWRDSDQGAFLLAGGTVSVVATLIARPPIRRRFSGPR
jgi:uncharacterized membrane protein